MLGVLLFKSKAKTKQQMKIALVKNTHFELILCVVKDSFNVENASSGVTALAAWELSAGTDFYDVLNGVADSVETLGNHFVKNSFVGQVVRAALLSDNAVSMLPKHILRVLNTTPSKSEPVSEPTPTYDWEHYETTSIYDFWVLAITGNGKMFFANLRPNGVHKTESGFILNTKNTMLVYDTEYGEPVLFLSEISDVNFGKAEFGTLKTAQETHIVTDFATCSPYLINLVLNRSKELMCGED